MERREMDLSEEGKLFVGGIAWDTGEDTLKDYFTNFGEVSHAAIMRDKTTGQPRGFGFVVFSDPSILDSVLQEKHTIDGRTVEVKRALSREEQQISRSKDPNANSSRNSDGQGNYKTRKIFVGGLPPGLTKSEFTKYFQNYGAITDSVIMFDQNTGRSRGFGFITYDTEDAVDRVLNKTFHELNNKLAEVKRALPKETNPGCGTRSRTSNAYDSYGASANTYNSQMKSIGFLQPQPAVGGYHPYLGYGAPSFGYGLANNGAVYGGFGAYALGSYESASVGYSGSAVSYGNQVATNTGFVGSSAGIGRSQWGSQTHGYGALGYGLNAGYGVTVPWATPGNTSLLGRSPRDTSVNSSYDGSEVSYTNSGRSRTVNRHRGSITKRNAGQNAVEAGQHGADGFTRRTYDSSNGSSQYPDDAA